MFKNGGRGSAPARERRLARDLRDNILMIALSSAGGMLVLCLILWGMFGPVLRSPERVKALKVGDVSYTAAEFNFYYFGAYQSLISKSSGSADMIGLDPSKSLASQTCTVSDGGISWQDYFTQQAEDALANMSVAYSEAVKAGVAMNRSISGTVDDVMEYYRVQAKSEGYSDFSKYLAATYGKGMTEDALRGLMEKTYVGKAYTDGLQVKYRFSEEELKAYYGEHSAENATCSYLYAYVGGGDPDGVCRQLSEAASETKFQTLAQKLTGSKCYTMNSVSGSALGASSSADVAWLSAAGRKTGDTYTGRSGSDRYVLYYLSGSDNGYSRGDASGAWATIAKTGLKEQTFAAWQKNMVAKYGISVLGGMKYARSLN